MERIAMILLPRSLWSSLLAALLAVAAPIGCKSSAPITIGAKSQRVRADDGFLLTTFPLEQTGRDAAPPRAILFYVPGSGDKSVTNQIDAMAGAVTMNIEVVLTERRGVQPNGAVDLAVFHKNDTRARRIADMRDV